MLLSASQRFIVHIDMNAYFASVEQQAHPEWRGRPVCVCAYLKEHGCVIAASREAKTYGIGVGTRVQDARLLAPNAVFVECDPIKYRSVTKQIFRIFHDYTDRIEHYSIDEAFLDLTGWYKDELSLIQALCQLKFRIQHEVGEWLTASIGVGPNKLLAKLASDYQKPDGLTLVGIRTLDDFLAEHRLQDIIGIGKRTERRLQRLGIFTPLELKNASPAMLLRRCGKTLYFSHAALNGLTVDAVNPYQPSKPKSIGHSYCVPKHLSKKEELLAIFIKLVDKAARRLRILRLTTKGIWVGINTRSSTPTKPISVFDRYTHSLNSHARFPEPVYDLFSITKSATTLFETLCNQTSSISFMAVSLWGLEPMNTQANLQGIETLERRSGRLSDALDAIRNKHGEHALISARHLKAGEHAPDRIGFRKVDG
ncbi:DNA polymerase IV [Patescibacteria group bacterium]|nr:DNA polymerase IV [Patescibacteria group bacterium]MBP9709919.1 DNA polymerase IV [Patescibacteria group bacterium]